MTTPSVPPTRILQTADTLINSDRKQDYGPPLEAFRSIALGWSEILGVAVDPQQVALCMIWLKTCRVSNNLGRTGALHRDSLLDIAGYVGVMDIMDTERARLWDEA
jgi:hypothetical protein